MAAFRYQCSKALVSIVLLNLCHLCLSIENQKHGSVNGSKTLLLGGIVPVHRTSVGGCGKITDYGVQYAEAIAYAVKTINSDPTFLRGIQLSFEVRDSCERIYTALEQTFLLLSPKPTADGNNSYGVSGVVGESESLTSIAIANLLHVFNVPQIDFGATAPSLSDKTRYDYFLRTLPPDNFQARALVDVIEHFGWSFVVTVNSGDSYGREGISHFVNYFRGAGTNNTRRCIAMETIEIPYPDASQNDYDIAASILLRPYVSNASVIVLFGQVETAQGLLDAMQRKREEFSGKKFVWVGTDGWAAYLDEEHKSLAKYVISTSHKTLNSSGFERYFRSLRVENASNPWFSEYWDEFNCSNVPGNLMCTPVDTYVPHTINAVYTFAHAVRKLQAEFCNGSGLCSAILRNDRGTTTLNGSLLLRYLKNVSFVSEVGNIVSFDKNGDPEIAEYTVNYLRPSRSSTATMVTSQMGSWQFTPSGRRLALRDFPPEVRQHRSSCSSPCAAGYYPQFIDGQPNCCWVCQPCPGDFDISDGERCVSCSVGSAPNQRKNGCFPIPVDYFRISNPWAVTTVLIACVGIVLTWAVIVILLLNHAHAVVKASSRELITILLLGIHLCYLMPFFFIIEPSAPICAIRRFGIGFSFSMCFSALLVRTIRIHRIFNRDSLTEPLFCVKPLSQVVFTMILVAVQVIISVIWLGIERPAVTKIFSGTTGELKCNENSYVGLALTLGYNAILLALATFYAFLTRKVPQNFNETKFISLTLYSLAVIWTAFLPVYFGTAEFGTVFQTSSILLAIVLSATILLGCLLFTKVYYLLRNLRISPHTPKKPPAESTSVTSTMKTVLCGAEGKKCGEETISLSGKSIMRVCISDKTVVDAFTQTD